jgi:hypothetical protein
MEDVGIFYGCLVYLTAIWYFYGHLLYFMVIWYIFPVLVRCTMKNLANVAMKRIYYKKTKNAQDEKSYTIICRTKTC